MSDLRAALKEIDSGKFYPVYVCSGTNRYSLEKFFLTLKDKLFKGRGLDFNYEMIDSQTRKISEIIDTANQLPVFSSKRLVIVENFKLPKAKEQDVLLNYLKDPADTTVLVVHASEEKSVTKLSKAISKKAKVLKFKDPYENQLAPWIREIAASYNKKLDPGVSEYFVSFVGNDLKRIDSEISKLSAFVGERQNITVEDVNSLVSDTKVETIFAFVDSVGSKNLSYGLKMLDKIIRSGEMPTRIISMLARHYRILWKVKRGLKKGMKGGVLAGYCGVSQYFMPKYIDHSRNFTAQSLIKVIGYLAKADVEIKTLNISKKLLVEKLCLDLTTL